MSTQPSQLAAGKAPHLGARILPDGSTKFTLWAPKHEKVHVVFPQSGKRQLMESAQDGYRTLTTSAAAGTRYFFELSEARLRPDPASRAQPDGVHEASMVVDWSTPAPFANRPLEEHVIYELHVGTFTPEGTFDAIVPRLETLRTLGVTAIELMPIAQFPGGRNWGYDGVLPFAAQSSYGGVDGLRRFVDACHAHGLACILDVVYNHMGPEGNYLSEFGPYFTDRYKTPWGAALNFDGRDSDHVREYFIQSALHWTRDCGIDGVRVDAVHAIIDHTATPFIQDLTSRVHEAAREQGRLVHVIAESCDNDPSLLRSREQHGVGIDGCWNDDFHHAVRAALTGERRGYYKAYGIPEQIATCVRDRFVFTGQYSESFGRRHGAPASDIPHRQLVTFTQNHDQVGNRPLGDRLDKDAGLDGARVAAALVLLSPFTPMLFMGEEHAEPAPFQYFVSHGDPALIDAVRKGRAAEFADFHGSSPVPDPQSEETFLQSKTSWHLRDARPHSTMLAYYARLLHLRTTLNIPARAHQVRCESFDSLVVMWYNDARPTVVLANLAKSTSTVPSNKWPVDTSGLAVVLNSEDRLWDGRGDRPEFSRHQWSIPPRCAVVLAPTESA